jgi:hypothetical protein
MEDARDLNGVGLLTCLALTNPEIEEFARLVPVGTTIEIDH